MEENIEKDIEILEKKVINYNINKKLGSKMTKEGIEEAKAIENVLADRERQQKEIKKKDKIIDEMAKNILEDTVKLDTFWCNGCFKLKECPFENRAEQCIKNWYVEKVEE